MTTGQLISVILGQIITLIAAVGYLKAQVKDLEDDVKDLKNIVNSVALLQSAIAVLQKDVLRIEARLDQHNNLDVRLTRIEALLEKNKI